MAQSGKLTSAQIDGAVMRYQRGEAVASIARALNVTPPSVRHQLKRRGLDVRKARPTLNESAFDSVTEESAYWVGFLMADGSVSPAKRGGPVIKLCLSAKDSGHVQKFKDFMRSTHKLTVAPARGGTATASFAFSSRRVADALASFGVTPRKTHSARAVRLEDNKHFWRGVVDGDGWVGLSGGLARLQLVGSLPLLHQFAAFVQSVTPGCRAAVRAHRGIYALHLNGRHARALLETLYGGCSVALTRKQEKAAEAVSLARRCDESKAARSAAFVPVREQRRLQGLCIFCGGLPIGGTTRCVRCLTYSTEWNRRKRAAL